ncbi:hypothetical protein [Leuconostoc mesenteroides]|uniref:hypothetical protein n=1 Tax=Leuconostoc mesenteroides TaxID=1245 RepID=UPI001363B6CF|nr:hypothetical protein [Leuconostoc mesenteroides]QHM55678.1 hypothetical protein C7M43_00380 [Leuconostoc mesenteroides]
MEKFILTIITAFVSAGGLGYLNYQILEAQGSLNVEDGSKSQNMWVIILGMINFGLFLALTKEMSLITAFFTTIGMSSIIFLIFGRKLFQMYWWIINHSVGNNGKINVSDKDPWDYFVDIKDDSENVMFIFSFEGNLITYGKFLGSNNSRDKNMGVRLQEYPQWDEEPTLNFVKKYASDYQVVSYLDTERKLLYYIVTF